MDAYMSSCIFLPDINNEHAIKRKAYARNLASLDRLVLFRFSDDSTVVPRDSAWFSLYIGTELVPMKVRSRA